MDIVLASASPRRRELMSYVAPEFRFEATDTDESAAEGLPADRLCLCLADIKCAAAAANNPQSCVIGCDTVVEIDGRVLGKPTGRAQAVEMLTLLSGRTHRVYTGVSVRFPGGQRSLLCRSDVSFFPITPKDIDDYVDSGEPFDKAGGYGIQGRAARFLERLEGDYYNVMGLPVSRLYLLLRDIGAF